MSNWIKPLKFKFVGVISVKIDTVVGCKGSKNIKFDVVHLEIEYCYIFCISIDSYIVFGNSTNWFYVLYQNKKYIWRYTILYENKKWLINK